MEFEKEEMYQDDDLQVAENVVIAPKPNYVPREIMFGYPLPEIKNEALQSCSSQDCPASAQLDSSAATASEPETTSFVILDDLGPDFDIVDEYAREKLNDLSGSSCQENCSLNHGNDEIQKNGPETALELDVSQLSIGDHPQRIGNLPFFNILKPEEPREFINTEDSPNPIYISFDESDDSVHIVENKDQSLTLNTHVEDNFSTVITSSDDSDDSEQITENKNKPRTFTSLEQLQDNTPKTDGVYSQNIQLRNGRDAPRIVARDNINQELVLDSAKRYSWPEAGPWLPFQVALDNLLRTQNRRNNGKSFPNNPQQVLKTSTEDHSSITNVPSDTMNQEQQDKYIRGSINSDDLNLTDMQPMVKIPNCKLSQGEPELLINPQPQSNPTLTPKEEQNVATKLQRGRESARRHRMRNRDYENKLKRELRELKSKRKNLKAMYTALILEKSELQITWGDHLRMCTRSIVQKKDKNEG